MSKHIKIGICISLFLFAQSVQSETLYDPTQPTTSAQTYKQISDFHLTSIMHIDGRYSAMINHKRVYVGSKVHQVTITEITDNTVTLSNGKVLKLFKIIKLD